MKTLVPNYTLSGNTVTLGGVNTPLDHLLFISDATTGNVLYSPAGPTLAGYATVAGNNAVATLSVSPSADTDLLTIYYDNGVNPVNAPSTVTVEGGSVGVSSIPAISGTVTLGAGAANIGNVSLTGGTVTLGASNITVPVSLNGGRGTAATLPVYDSIVGGTVTLGAGSATIPVSLVGDNASPLNVSLTGGYGTASSLPSYASITNLPARNWNLSQANDTVYASLGNQSVAVTGTFYQATQPVSGSLSGVTLSGSSGVTLPVNGSLTAYGSDSLGTLHQLRTDSLGNQGVYLTGSTATLPVSIASDSASPFNVTLSGVSGVTLPVSGFPSVQNVSLVGDSLTAIGTSLAAGVGTASSLPSYASITNFPSVQNVSLVGDSLTAIGTSLSAGPGTSSVSPAYAYVTVLPSNLGTSVGSPVYASLVGDNASPLNVSLTGGYGTNATLPAYDTIVGGTVTLGTGSNTIGSVSLASAQTLTAYAATSGITNTGSTTAATTSGGASVVAGTSCTKMLTVQNTGTLNNLYFYCNNTSLNATANGLQLAPGQGYQFSVLPSSSQYLYLQGNTAYALMYA